MDEHLVTELIALERRIAADEYMLALVRAAGGTDANKATLEADLKRRIAETVTRMDSLRIGMTTTTAPPIARPKRTRSNKRSSPVETGT